MVKTVIFIHHHHLTFGYNRGRGLAVNFHGQSPSSETMIYERTALLLHPLYYTLCITAVKLKSASGKDFGNFFISQKIWTDLRIGIKGMIFKVRISVMKNYTGLEGFLQKFDQYTYFIKIRYYIRSF